MTSTRPAAAIPVPPTPAVPPPGVAGWLANGPFADPRDQAPRLARLLARAGPDPRALAEAVRSWLVHPAWRAAYGVPEDPARTFVETNLRDLRAKLVRIGELQASLGRSPDDTSPLPYSHKLIGNCRDHSVLYAALLRAAGIPARARCGFGRYFQPGKWIDHWIVERWDGGRWVQSDAQLDAVMREASGFAFDPMDMPDGEFRSGGEAWLACRGGDDPLRYGILEVWGWDLVCSNLVKDVNALASRELLPWDDVPHEEQGEAGQPLLDALAQATPMRATLTAGEAQALARHPGIGFTGKVVTYARGAPEELDLGAILDA